MNKLQKRLMVNRLREHYTLNEIVRILGMSKSTVLKYEGGIVHGI